MAFFVDAVSFTFCSTCNFFAVVKEKKFHFFVIISFHLVIAWLLISAIFFYSYQYETPTLPASFISLYRDGKLSLSALIFFDYKFFLADLNSTHIWKKNVSFISLNIINCSRCAYLHMISDSCCENTSLIIIACLVEMIKKKLDFTQ